MNTSPAGTARFLFGLVGFVLILALLSQLDDERGTSYTWGYIAIVLLGILTFQHQAIASGLSDLQSALR